MKLKNLRINPLNRIQKERKEEPSTSENKTSEVILPSDSNFNHIKCKAVRYKKCQQLMKEKIKAKKEAKKKKNSRRRSKTNSTYH